MNVGSLFSGIGGLDQGVELALGATPAWFCESDPDCHHVLKARYPGIPIIPDVRDIDDTAERVDILTGGFPCPDFSVAGKRLMFAGERAQLWFEMARCIRVLRPRLVVVENVPGLLTALGVVLADLAEAGYVGSWVCVRAADVGAPHRRERVFIVARDASANAELAGNDADRRVHRRDPGRGDQRRGTPLPAGAEMAYAADAVADRAGTLADASSIGRGAGPGLCGSDQRRDGRGHAHDDRRETPADADGEHGEPRSRGGATGGANARAEQEERDRSGFVGEAEPGPPCGCLWEWIDAGGFCACCHAHIDDPRGLYAEQPFSGHYRTCPAATDAAGERRNGRPTGERRDAERRQEAERTESHAAVGDSSAVEWGTYGPAVQRWEQILGRPAPRPTDDRGRLNPDFVEWMMGFPEGWTNVAGLKRAAKLRMLGNAVVPQTAALALTQVAA